MSQPTAVVLSDFGSELLLNRIQNGQIEPRSKKTVNTAGRALAENFDAAGYNYGVLAENIATGKAIVEGSENALTEIKDIVERLGAACAALEDQTDCQNMAKEIWKNVDAVLATQLGPSDTPVFDTRNNGLNLTIGEGETLKVGGINLEQNAFRALKNAVSNGSIDSSNALDLSQKAMDQLLMEIADQGAKHKILSNRQDLYSDLTSIYHTASDDTAKTSISSLFSAVM
ncbi:MAG: hypothetical protein IJS50_06260 [Desulfovibrio sp.]|nr:hypothetical protein [Desulfovibrio sp.]